MYVRHYVYMVVYAISQKLNGQATLFFRKHWHASIRK